MHQWPMAYIHLLSLNQIIIIRGIAPQAEKWHLLSAMGTSKEGKEPEPHRLPPGVLQRAQLQQRRGVRQQVLRHVDRC